MNNKQNQSTQYNFNMFDLNSMFYDHDGITPYSPKICIIAPSGTGKSWIVRSILYHLKELDSAIVICPTDKMTKFYDSFVPSLYIHHQFDPDMIQKILDRQRKMIVRYQKKIQEDKNPALLNKDLRLIFVMDDCMSSRKQFVHLDSFNSLMYEGRHYQIIFIMTMQYCLSLPPDARNNFEYIFLLSEDKMQNRVRLYDNYAGMFPNQNIFNAVFDQITKDFKCMVINNRYKKDNNLENKIFWYKAVDHSPFTIGSTRYKSFAKKHFNSEYEEYYDNLLTKNYSPFVSVKLQKEEKSPETY
ncbi:putative VV A32-like packaging ATPase [Namao virus]|nr:putative VV A32-like packaging ATPase [Namao virus]